MCNQTEMWKEINEYDRRAAKGEVCPRGMNPKEWKARKKIIKKKQSKADRKNRNKATIRVTLHLDKKLLKLLQLRARDNNRKIGHQIELLLTQLGDQLQLQDDSYQEAFVAFRQALRQLLSDHGIASNPAVEDNWIVNQLRKLLKKTRP